MAMSLVTKRTVDTTHHAPHHHRIIEAWGVKVERQLDRLAVGLVGAGPQMLTYLGAFVKELHGFSVGHLMVLAQQIQQG